MERVTYHGPHLCAELGVPEPREHLALNATGLLVNINGGEKIEMVRTVPRIFSRNTLSSIASKSASGMRALPIPRDSTLSSRTHIMSNASHAPVHRDPRGLVLVLLLQRLHDLLARVPARMRVPVRADDHVRAHDLARLERDRRPFLVDLRADDPRVRAVADRRAELLRELGERAAEVRVLREEPREVSRKAS